MRPSRTLAALACIAIACVRPPVPEAAPRVDAGVVLARNAVAPAQGELRFAAVRQLTAGGQNAEAYFSRDGRWLTFQSAQLDYPCDQQYVMRVDGVALRRVSDGRGKTTCGWFFPGGDRLFFGSTTAHQDRCPPKPDPISARSPVSEERTSARPGRPTDAVSSSPPTIAIPAAATSISS